jgi:flagellar motility protein MotE (MotC chaperone)
MQLGLRVMPVTIAALVMVLGLRIGDLWQGAAQAQQQPWPPQRGTTPSNQAPLPGTAAANPPAPQAQPAVPPRILDDAGGFSAAELDVLQSLMARREALEQRSGELDRREAVLRAAEGRIEAKIQELKQLQATLDATMRKYDEMENARQKSLVKMFETMKPKDAARIFEQMEVAVLVTLVENMREAKAAPILAELNPVRAKQITAELAKRRPPVAPGG